MWRDEAYLVDMSLAAREVMELCRGVTGDRFGRDRKLQLAVMHLVQNIGEAARQVSKEFKDAHPEIPWSDIAGMRNKLVHEYFRIIPEKVWEVVEKDLPDLIRLLSPLAPPDLE